MWPTFTVTTMDNNPVEKLLTMYYCYSYYSQGNCLHATSIHRHPSKNTIQHCFVVLFFSPVPSHFSHGRFEVSLNFVKWNCFPVITKLVVDWEA